jgi:hypothetical protein
MNTLEKINIVDRMIVKSNRHILFMQSKNITCEKIHFSTLFYLFMSILFRNKQLNNQTYEICKSILYYDKLIDEYNMMTNMDKQRKYIYNTLQSMTININELCKMLKEKSPQKFNIELYNRCIESIEFIKTKMSLVYSNDLTDTNIINEFNKRVTTKFKIIKKFNCQELVIYNLLIDLINNQLIYVINHCRIPVQRIKQHDLFADYFLIFNIDNTIKFAIIEFDGPTHTQFDFRFSESTINCDMIKNNFCKTNNISMCRINHNDFNNINLIIRNFIDSVIVSVQPIYIGIQSDCKYNLLISNYREFIFNRFDKYYGLNESCRINISKHFTKDIDILCKILCDKYINYIFTYELVDDLAYIIKSVN